MKYLIAGIVVALGLWVHQAQAYDVPDCPDVFEGQLSSWGIRDCVLDGRTPTMVKPTNDRADFVVVDDVLVVRNNTPGKVKFEVIIE